jgi:transcriptional regulator with GAF, ATPase, and Fis domain
MTAALSVTLLLTLWREATRHASLADAVAVMATRVQEAWLHGGLAVRGFDRAAGALVLLADSAEAAPVPERAVLTPDARAALERWLAGSGLGTVAGLRADAPALAATLPAGAGEDWLVGALHGAHGQDGVLLARPAAGRAFTPADQAAFAALREPFAAALDTHERVRELARLRDAVDAERERLLCRLGGSAGRDALIGADGGLRAVFERVALVGKSDVPVLILGETGSGKEMVAREIHQRSPRAAGPFVRVNCGAIPPELIDSELFGHERGSFTGATSQRRGWFERANGGTLLLDEIGDLPPAAQVRLLRVLQDGYVQRVGGERGIQVDVRIVAATHRDLPLMIQEGHFREDLWYRLATFPIVLPPLRERRGDIPALARHFARRAASRFGLRLQLPTAADLALLCAYDWPGNVRELAAVLDRAAILGDGRALDVATALGAVPTAPARTPPAAAPATAGGPTLTLDEAMRRHIEAALAACHGRIEGPHGAARALAINPHTLRARMRKLGIERRRFDAAGA